MDAWDMPLDRKLTRHGIYWNSWNALEKNPALSLLTKEARQAIAVIVADAQPVEDNSGQDG